MIYALQAYLQKKKPVFVVADDIAYHEGMQNILFFKAGAEIYSQHIYGESKVYFDRKDRIARRGKLMNMLIRKQLDSVSGEAEKRAEEMLTARFAGKGGRELDRGAFAGKRVLNRQETMELLGLPSDKKNIVIMAHTFTDAVFNYGQLYYRDYYDWLEQTLQIAGKNDKVNWILKPHPTRSAYNESEDSIEKMYEKHRRDNIFFLPDHVSAESIRDIADVIVTIGGNAGAEFACFGIPAVIIGEPYYKGFGYTLEPRSRMEYEQLLMHIEETEPLKEEQILTAKKVFYMNAQKQLEGKAFSDEFASILLEENQNMNDQIAVQLFENNKGTQAYNDTVMDSITGYFSAHGIEECEYYQRGKMRGYHRQKI